MALGGSLIRVKRATRVRVLCAPLIQRPEPNALSGYILCRTGAHNGIAGAWLYIGITMGACPCYVVNLALCCIRPSVWIVESHGSPGAHTFSRQGTLNLVHSPHHGRQEQGALSR